MSIPPQLLALGILFIFGTILFLVIQTSRRQKADQDSQLHQLGFNALESAPPELQQRTEELYQNQEVRLWRVYQRRELDQNLYLFDAADVRGESSELGSEVFGIISSQLALPRFSLTTIPEFDRESLIGGLMDKLLDKVMSYAERHLQLQRIEFPDQPELDDQVILFGQDPTTVREMVERIRFSSLRLGGLPVQIAGRGDFLTVDFSTANSINQPSQDLASRYQTFIQISRRFME